ncbi:MAG: ATP-binding protein [Candidatus Latescibacteria bacterium]|nr:ATP-binding protein [Candidatus Latescibacterota bacterium]
MKVNSPKTDPSARIDLPGSDPGYFYDPQVTAGQHGEIRLSPRVDKHCKCGGRPPYQIFQRPDADPVWCPCRRYRLKTQEINRLIRYSGIPDPFRFKFLDHFYETYDGRPIEGADELKRHLRNLIEKARKWNASRDTSARASASQPMRGYFLTGGPGVGKTYFSYVALNELIFHSGRPGRFISLSKAFFQRLRFAFDENSPMHGKSEAFLRTLGNVPFLVIADFGVQRNTEWELEMLYNLVDTRYANRRFTIVTANQDIENVKKLADGRLYSRFVEMCYIVRIKASDFREHAREVIEI